MNVWLFTTDIVNKQLEFTRIRYFGGYADMKGYIYFADTNNITNGYIELDTRYLYYTDILGVVRSYNLDIPYSFVEFDYNMKIIGYTDCISIKNYAFWTDDVTQNEGDENQETTPPSTSTDGILTIINTELRLREKQQVRPIDLTQGWADTGAIRDSAEFEPQYNDCKCSPSYRWVNVGEICDGVNRCEKLQYQVKDDCYSSWKNYTPEIYKVGNIIEFDSALCGTHEYKEVWENELYCGSYLNDYYNANLISTSKYRVKNIYIKPKDESEWTKLECGTLFQTELAYSNSFECGWEDNKIEIEYDYDLCGNVAMSRYPSLTGLSSTNEYRVTINHHYKTAPYPQNRDNTPQSEWVWIETATTYSATVTENNSCACGYYYTQWDATNEYSCGSELGNTYTSTTKYRKEIENKYCNGNLLEPTGNIRWVVYDSQSCECGYRITTSTTEYDYTYVCGDDIGLDSGYMYYTEIVKTYSQCTDGSNKELIDTTRNYVEANHSTSSVTTCEYNAEYNAYINKLVTTYRTYYDENDYTYKFVECNGNRIITNQVLTEKSSACGYKEEWAIEGTICCGGLDLSMPTLTIISTSGDWKRNGKTFTSNAISNNQNTYMTITFNVSRQCKISLNYDVSSESGYDEFYYSLIDSSITNFGGFSGTKTGTIQLDCTEGEHFINLRYSKDQSQSSGRDNVIVTLDVVNSNPCTNYGKYNLEYFRYSVDNGKNWIIPQPIEYRYGSLIETNSEECGYIPRLEQWVLVCPNITYETATENDGCTICETYNGAPTMYAIEKKQYSIDGGKTWIDITPQQLRTERILKWKADKCGYTGDIFEYRWSNTYCDGTSLIGTRTTYVSSDNGETWSAVEGTSIIAIKEDNSSECQEEGTE